MRWGLVGASNIASAHMIAALRSVPGSDIGWVQTGSLAHGQTFAAAAGIAHVTTRIEDILADPGVDAVYISSTNEKHRDQALAALAAGKHVLCEKPLAMTVRDAVGMVRAAAVLGRVFATNHHLRCSGSHRAIRALVAQGRIGRVLSMRIHHAVHLPPFLQGWRIDAPAAGGGVIADITVHDADTARFVLGEDAVSIVATAASSGMGQGVEDSCMSVWTMASGAMVFAHESFTHRFAGTGLEVHGTEGSIFARGVMTQAPVGAVDLVTDAGRVAVPYATHDLYAQGAADFAAAVAGTGRLAADGVDGVKSLGIALAVKEAAATGRRVDVDFGGI